MPKIYCPDNFKIEVVKHYKMHRNIDLTLEKYEIACSTLFKWKKKYEENHFFRVSKKPTDAGHKAKAHLDKLNKIVEASKELVAELPLLSLKKLPRLGGWKANIRFTFCVKHCNYREVHITTEKRKAMYQTSMNLQTKS